MTKTLKNTLIILLCALLSLCVGLFLFSGENKSVSADNTTTTGLSDNNFSFVSGASIWTGLFDEDPESAGFDLSTARTRLRFDLKLTNFNYENLANSVNHAHAWFSSSAGLFNAFIYEFTLYRGNRDGDGSGNFQTGTKQHSVLVVLFPSANKTFFGYIAERNYGTNSSITVHNPNYPYSEREQLSNFLGGQHITSKASGYDTDYEDIAKSGDYYTWVGAKQYFGTNYVITDRFKLSNNNLNFYNNDGKCISLIANVDSPFSYYYIQMRYCYDVSYDGWGNTHAIEYGKIYSSSRSVANVLEHMVEQGVDLEHQFGDRAVYANQILSIDNTQRVRIKYLTAIEGTPYATHNYAYVDVPILWETIRLADVEDALGFSIGKCLDSTAVGFRKTTDNDGELYQVYYLKNVWLRSATSDGNYLDYFLDINESYKEFYYPYVVSGALSEDAFEWIYSVKFLNKFPELYGYTVNEIYGYFGMIITPESYSLNSALKEIFDIKTSKIGIISNFSYEGYLSDSAYNSLMSEYGYGWLSRTWGNVANFFNDGGSNAKFYVIYSEPGTESGLIGEGGQTDIEEPGSVIGNKIVKPITSALSSAWNGLTGFVGGIASNFKTILYIGLAIVVVIVIIKIRNGRSKK